jgi:uncharacterized protein YjbJ (UPF0337 family)
LGKPPPGSATRGGTRPTYRAFGPAEARFIFKELAMNKDRVAGAAKETAGGIKEKTGEVLGDKKMEAEGKVKKAEGKVQNTFGKAEDASDQALHEAERADRRR